MFNFNINKHNYKHIHFIGIGGISMSGLAEIMLSEDYIVSGSDSKKSSITENLKKKGATIYNFHDEKNLAGADLVVYTDAITMDNEELKAAIKFKIDIIDRASFLGSLMKNYKKSIAVSGTHGKTTTTSMITDIIRNLDSNPTILLGGQLDNIDGNVKLGQKDLFLTEACEYKANILKYYPTTAIILNIDEDHLDFFNNIEHIITTFRDYVKKINNNLIILNIDDSNTKLLIKECKNYVTFSTKSYADYYAKNISFSKEGYPSYDLFYKRKFVSKVKLSVMGEHNISNSIAAIASVVENGISFNDAINGIESYKGAHRRLEIKGIVDDVVIIDDYAHHPTEIKASLKAIKKSCKRNLFCIFQPHTFTRTKLLLDSFSKSFSVAQKVIITDIYAAREKDYGDIHSIALSDAINKNSNISKYIKDFEGVIDYLKKNVKPGDTIVTMGAGDVYKIGDIILKDNNL